MHAFGDGRVWGYGDSNDDVSRLYRAGWFIMQKIDLASCGSGKFLEIAIVMMKNRRIELYIPTMNWNHRRSHFGIWPSPFHPWSLFSTFLYHVPLFTFWVKGCKPDAKVWEEAFLRLHSDTAIYHSVSGTRICWKGHHHSCHERWDWHVVGATTYEDRVSQATQN